MNHKRRDHRIIKLEQDLCPTSWNLDTLTQEGAHYISELLEKRRDFLSIRYQRKLTAEELREDANLARQMRLGYRRHQIGKVAQTSQSFGFC